VRLERNATTQPRRPMRVFNNPDVLVCAWYVACRSEQLRSGAALSCDVGLQRLVVFRGESGRVHALDAYCPHLGADLGLGRVRGETIACSFHGWAYDGSGVCVDAPCGGSAPRRARLRAYDTEERYGLVWVYPEGEAPYRVLEVPDLEGQPVRVHRARPEDVPGHHHIHHLNGVDVHHLPFVHRFKVDLHEIGCLNTRSSERPDLLDTTTRVPATAGLMGRFMTWFAGTPLEVLTRFSDATSASVTLLHGARLFGGRFASPGLHYLIGYTPLPNGDTRLYITYLTRRRSGPLGALADGFLLRLTRFVLGHFRREDRELLAGIRVRPYSLTPADRPCIDFIEYANGLPISDWSRAVLPDETTSQVAPAQASATTNA